MNATMNVEQMLFCAAVLAVIALVGIYQAWAYRDKDDKGPEMSAPAIVRSSRVKTGKAPTLGSHWDYMMTFALADGEEVELYVTADIFSTLKEGQSGQLTWQGKRFYYFDSDA